MRTQAVASLRRRGNGFCFGGSGPSSLAAKAGAQVAAKDAQPSMLLLHMQAAEVTPHIMRISIRRGCQGHRRGIEQVPVPGGHTRRAHLPSPPLARRPPPLLLLGHRLISNLFF